MSKEELQSIANTEKRPSPKKQLQRQARAAVESWETQFNQGDTKIARTQDAETESRYLIRHVRQMSGSSHVLCRRKMSELADRIEGATIEGLYSDDVLNRMVADLRLAAERESDPSYSAPWSDERADLGWKGRQLQLANYLWSKNPKAADDWRVDLADLKLSVWGNEDAKTGTVKSCVSRLSSFLKDRNIKNEINLSDPENAAGHVRVRIEMR